MYVLSFSWFLDFWFCRIYSFFMSLVSFVVHYWTKMYFEPRGQWPISKTMFLFKLFILNLWSILIQLFSKDFNVFMCCHLRIVSFCFLSSMIAASWHAMPTCTWFMPLHGPLAKWFGTSFYIWNTFILFWHWALQWTMFAHNS